ncbi:MAG: sugar transferase [Opitutales bacterium]|nr:sugar transferase [Opitutales bacterium]
MLRRAFDILASFLGLLALLPLFAGLAVWVKLDSRGPVFYRAPRVGRGGKPFKLWKFRSMAADAASRGPGITAGGDPRVTRAGAFLRKTKMDELPQLINVLCGEMTFVGPRPEDPRYVAKRPELYAGALELKPGITGAGSLAYRDEESVLAGKDLETAYFEEVLPRKLAADVAYARRQTLWSDIGMILKTVGRMFR